MLALKGASAAEEIQRDAAVLRRLGLVDGSEVVTVGAGIVDPVTFVVRGRVAGQGGRPSARKGGRPAAQAVIDGAVALAEPLPVRMRGSAEAVWLAHPMATPDFILELRDKIGDQLLWLAGVTAVVLRGHEVLLVRRADNGWWTPVTGVIDPGEEQADAAVREVLEEADVVADAERLSWVHVLPPMTYENGDHADAWIWSSGAAGSAGVHTRPMERTPTPAGSPSMPSPIYLVPTRNGSGWQQAESGPTRFEGGSRS